MALAIIELAEAGPAGPRFRIEIGTNRYYSYAIGGTEADTDNGIDMLRDPIYTSPVFGPLPPSARGRAVVDVPRDRFDAQHRCVQLASFRTRDRIGPAVSRIVTVSPQGPALDDLPPPALFTEPRRPAVARAASVWDGAGANMTRVETVPYNVRHAEAYSSAMFLDAITSLLPKILPDVGKLIGGLFQSGGKAADGTPAPPNVLDNLAKPEAVKLITDLIKQISSAKSTGRTVVYRSADAHQAASFALTRYRHQFSEAKVAPALLAALPALMPIIEKALNPETVKAVMENVSPAKLMGAVTESVANFAKLGMESEKQLQEHLERLNPGVKNPALYKLLEGLSTGEARAGARLKYKRVDTVKLSLDGLSSQTLYGRSRLAYAFGRDLSFPLHVETPKPIRHATMEVSLKEAATLKVMYERQQPVAEIGAGPVASPPKVPSSALSRLKVGEDYMLTIAISWNGKQGAPKRGTSISQLITLVSDYAFDRVEDTSPELVPLGDAARDRDFWHRLWEQTFQDKHLTRLRLSCEYCYVLDADRKSNARMQTTTKVDAASGTERRTGRLKSGMIVSPDALNQLLPRLTGGTQQPLSEAQLDALRSPDFVDRFNQAARTQVDLKGRRGESAALWAYPEMKLQDVVLKKAAKIDENGHVRQFEEETVKFPMPALVHFVGTASGEAGEGAALDGQNIVFDQKIGLYPANLHQKASAPPAKPAVARASRAFTRRWPAYVH